MMGAGKVANVLLEESVHQSDVVFPLVLGKHAEQMVAEEVAVLALWVTNAMM